MTFNKIIKAHFIGIGGIGMSALARLFLHEGKEVSGSDRSPSIITKALEREGVELFDSQTAENIKEREDLDLVIYTEAMPEDHPEMVAARELGIPMMNYFEALGAAVNDHYLIAIAGTHGKTTTTAMLTDVFEEAGLDPTAIIGSLRSKTGSNFRAGKSKYAIVEACEYKRDFLTLQPDVLVITNLEHEHVDYYKDLADVQNAFRELALKVPEDGFVVCEVADPALQPVIQDLKAKVIDYKDYLDISMQLKQPGLHNLKNAAAAAAAADVTKDTEPEEVKQALENFAGTWRRYEYKGELNGAPVYDDYGHHPTEITATIAGTRDFYKGRRIVVVFQPHTYSRLKELFDDFADSLSKADKVLIAPIYAAREVSNGLTSQTLAEAIKKGGSFASAPEDFDEIISELKEYTEPNDVVLVMGAGNITEVSNILTEK